MPPSAVRREAGGHDLRPADPARPRPPPARHRAVAGGVDSSRRSSRSPSWSPLAVGAIWIATQVGRPTPPAAGTVSFDQRAAHPAARRVARRGRRARLRSSTRRPARPISSPQGTTPTLGYNGSYLGPTLVAERGERVRVDVTNGLDEATTVHWHGMHLPAAMDGGPHSPIAPGETWYPEWTIDQPAATLWYHPHLHGETERRSTPGSPACSSSTTPRSAP